MASSPFYRDILKNAWLITWRYKFLWIFGFFAALILGNGGETEVMYNNYQNILQSPDTLVSLKNLYQGGFINTVVANLKYLFTHQPLTAILVILFLLALLAILIWLAITSQVALFDSVNKISRHEKTSLSIAYKAGVKYFSPAFIINLLGRILIWLLFLLLALPLISYYLFSNNSTGALLFVILAIIVLLPVMLIIYFIVKFAVAYVVIKNFKIYDAIKAGWQMFIKNWLVVIEMALIILLISAVSALIFIIAAAVVAIPFVIWAVLALLFGAKNSFLAAMTVGIIPIILVITIIGAAFSTYQYSAWTLLFLKISEAKGSSKIVRMLTAVFSKKTTS